MVDDKCYVYSSILPVHKAVIAGPAGLLSAGPLFWPSMLSAVSLLLVLAHFTQCLPFIDAIINITRVARVKTLKDYIDNCLINFIIRWS